MSSPDSFLSAQDVLSLFEGSGRMGAWWSHLQSCELHWSPGLYRIFGLDPQHYRPSFETYADLIHPEDRPDFPRNGRLVSEALLRPREFRVIRPDGGLRWLADQGQVLFDPDGRPMRMFGVVTDVTDRVAMHQDFATLSAFVGALAGLGDAAVWDAWPRDGAPDPEPLLREPAADDVLRLAPQMAAVDPGDREEVLRRWEEALRTGRDFAAEYRVLARDGRPVRVRSRAVPRREGPGLAGGWVGASRRADGGGVLPEGEAVTASQVRAARGFLGWSANELATRSGLSLSTIRRVEAPGERLVREDGLSAIRTTLEAAGIVFTCDAEDRRGLSFGPAPGCGAG